MNDKLKTMFYIGSCRYQPLFENYFPPRLHSTKEVIYFLENYKNIDIKHPDIDYIYADIIHPGLIHDSMNFLEKNKTTNIFKNIDTLVLEICSRKVCMIGNNVYSDYKNNNKYTSSSLTYDDILTDLIYIKNLSNQLGIKNIVVLSHVSLPLANTKNIITDRETLCDDLLLICNELKIHFINPGKLYDTELNKSHTLQDILPDTIHYENDLYLEIILKHLKELK